MNDDLEPRLRNAFRHSPLPAAPASLVESLERVPHAPVTARRRAGGRGVWAPLAVAAVLVAAAAAVIGGGQHGIAPGPSAVAVLPSTPATLQPSPLASAPPTGTLRVVYQARHVNGIQPIAGDVEVIIDIVAHRLAAAGIVGASLRGEGDDRLIVELPAAIDTDAARRLIGQTGHIDFVPLGTTSTEVGGPIDPATFPALFSGDQIESAAVTTGPQGRTITFALKPRGAGLFADYTARHIGQYFAIVLDSKVVSAPIITSEIRDGHVEISTGGIDGYPLEEAQGLVGLMQFGALPYPIVEISNEILPAPSISVP
jgi:hypothetical protein